MSWTSSDLEIIKNEILDKYDIFDVFNLLDTELEVVYPLLEEYLLANVHRLELECLDSGRYRQKRDEN